MSDAISGKTTWASFVSLVTMALGGVLAVAAWAVPYLGIEMTGWKTEDAKAYSEASRSYHALSTQPPSPRTYPKVEAARGEYLVLRKQLDSARQRRGRLSGWLLSSGVVLLVAGAVSQAASHFRRT